MRRYIFWHYVSNNENSYLTSQYLYKLIICAYGEAERRYCSGGVYGDVGMYVDKITRRRIDKYNAFCMHMLLILLITTLALHESVMLSIKGNIKVYMVNSSAPRAGELEVCM